MKLTHTSESNVSIELRIYYYYSYFSLKARQVDVRGRSSLR